MTIPIYYAFAPQRSMKAVDTKFVPHYIRAMKNVTITLDEKVANWARIRAAERETSVSRLVGEMLEEKMHEEEAYHAAMQQFLSKQPAMIKEPGTKYPSRDKLHDR